MGVHGKDPRGLRRRQTDGVLGRNADGRHKYSATQKDWSLRHRRCQVGSWLHFRLVRLQGGTDGVGVGGGVCLLYTSPSPRDRHRSRMPSSA